MQLEPGPLVMTSTMRAFDGLLIGKRRVNRASLTACLVFCRIRSSTYQFVRYAAQLRSMVASSREIAASFSRKVRTWSDRASGKLTDADRLEWRASTMTGANRAARIAIDIAARRARLTNPSLTMLDRPRG